MMDIKGDFSGIAKREKSFYHGRQNKHTYQTASFPVELLSLSEQMVFGFRNCL
jgi:hypothetical protein